MPWRWFRETGKTLRSYTHTSCRIIYICVILWQRGREGIYIRLENFCATTLPLTHIHTRTHISNIYIYKYASFDGTKTVLIFGTISAFSDRKTNNTYLHKRIYICVHSPTAISYLVQGKDVSRPIRASLYIHIYNIYIYNNCNPQPECPRNFPSSVV